MCQGIELTPVEDATAGRLHHAVACWAVDALSPCHRDLQSLWWDPFARAIASRSEGALQSIVAGRRPAEEAGKFIEKARAASHGYPVLSRRGTVSAGILEDFWTDYQLGYEQEIFYQDLEGAMSYYAQINDVVKRLVSEGFGNEDLFSSLSALGVMEMGSGLSSEDCMT